MSRKPTLRRAARCEFDESADWYERQQPGLGPKFVEAVHRTLDVIAKRPEAYPVVLKDVREIIVQGFPFCIYYRKLNQTIEVLAIFHNARDPAIWQRRT